MVELLTSTLDYDAHQKFGVKGMVEFRECITSFSGRVESDEGSPNSVYVGSTNNGFYAYEDSGYSAYMRLQILITSQIIFVLS